MSGEQNYPFICRQIDALGFDGYLGLEYALLKPRASPTRRGG